MHEQTQELAAVPDLAHTPANLKGHRESSNSLRNPGMETTDQV